MHRKPMETGGKEGGKTNRRDKKATGEVQLQEQHEIRCMKMW